MSAGGETAAPFEAASRPGAAIKVGFIVGPTGSGKSAVAVEVAERLGAEIVNADSRQFYRGMDIGTAKPSAAERRRAPHHLIDVRAPGEPLDAATFVRMAREAISAIARRDRPVLVVGGSGLYLRALSGGIFSGPPACPGLRRELEQIAAERGAPFLHGRLNEADPAAAARIQRNDRCRIVRALEVYRLTGVPISVHQRRHSFSARELEPLTVGLALARPRLYAAIDQRFDAMMAAGLVDEVRALLAAGPRPAQPLLSAIGYREIAAFVRGDLGLEQAVALAKRATRRLAKRQLTWFRREPDIIWVDADRAREQALLLFGKFFFGPEGAA